MKDRLLPFYNAGRIAGEAGPLQPPLIEVAPQRLRDMRKRGATGCDVLHTKGYVVLSFPSGWIGCFDGRTFTEIWCFAVPEFDPLARFDGTAVLVENEVIVRVADAWSRLDLASGAITKTFTGPRMDLRRGLVCDGGMIATFWDGKTSCIGSMDLSTGELKWSQPLSGPAASVLTAGKGIVGLATTPSIYSAFNTDDGQLQWELDVRKLGQVQNVFGLQDGVVSGWSIVVNDLFVMPVRSGYWLGVNIATGLIRWELQVPCHNPGNGVYAGAGYLYTFADGHYIVIDPATGTLIKDELVDSADLAMGGIGSPLLTDTHVWGVHIDSGRVFALERASGRPDWISEPGGATTVDSAPSLNGGFFYTVDLAGNLRVFQGETA